MRFIVSPRARADIEDIWNYTVGQWGERQAEIYLRLLQAAVDAVASDPEVGQTCDDVQPGYRKYRVGSHVMFYRVNPNTVVVVRILHQRMDVGRHL